MKYHFYWIAFVLLASTMQAQNDSVQPEIEFAFASRSSMGIDAAQRIPGDTVKYNHALAIYNRLVAARGDYRAAIPDFVMSRDVRRVAWMNYDRMEIGLEEKAYDICMTFGADADAALAAMIGHELSHYYEKHGWRRDFAQQYADLEVGKQLGVLSQTDQVFNETQADYIGGFLAYSAGFPVFGKSSEMTGALYKAYGFPDVLPNYPVLDERKQLNVRSAQLLEKLVNVSEIANYLNITGKYRDAAMYYQYVLQQYQSPSLYNNAGIMALLSGLDLGRDTSFSYVLPIELDMTSIGSRGKTEFDAREKLFREALRHFEAAINMDPDYAPAYLNKACAYVLLHDNARAKYYATVEVPAVVKRKPAYKKTGTDAQVVLAIIEVMDGNKTSAEKILQDAYNQDSSAVALENLVRLKTGKPSPFVALPSAISFVPETIDDINLLLEAEELGVDYKNRINIGDGRTFFQNLNPGPNSKLLVGTQQADGKEVKCYFLITRPDYKGKTAKKIQVGSSANAVSEAYKSPKKTIETTTGQSLLYNDIIFFIGPAPESKVMGWALWLEN